MVKVKKLGSWNINANNLDETARFYRDILGADEGRTSTVAGVAVARLPLGGISLGLFDASDGPRPGVPHHTFQIEGPDDAETLVKELEARGVKVDGVRQHGEGPGYSVYVYDPSGNRLELSHEPA